MATMELLTAEMHMEQSHARAAWALARAAACPWFAVCRRVLLIRLAREHQRDAAAWRARYYAEIRISEHRWLYEDPAA